MAEPGIYHEFESQVADEETEGLIKPQAHWNAKHKPYKLLGYELVEEKNLPAGTTTCTFSGLDGDIDDEYLFEFDLSIIGSGYTGIALLPNNISTNQSGFWAYHYNGNSGQDASFNWIPFGYYFYAENHDTVGSVIIRAKTGLKRRFIIKNYIPVNNGHFGMVDGVFIWNELVTKITSFVLACKTGGSFSGVIRLWKRLPIIPVV